MKKLLTFLMVAIIACGVLGSGGCQKDSKKAKVEAEINVVYGTDKVLQSYGKDTNTQPEGIAYMDRADFVAFKNEYESRQIIINPKSDVKKFNVNVGSFVSSAGDSIPLDAFDVRYEYYHRIGTIFDYNSKMLPGMYPDALLPLKTAQKYGLDTIAAGENQGIFITVKIPKGQPSGVYSGSFNVILNGVSETNIPASITVLDYTMPDTVSLKTSFQLQRGYLIQAELDNTPEMYNKHIEEMMKFRLSTAQLNAYTVNNVTYEQSIVAQIEDAVEAAQNPARSAYCIWTYTEYNDKLGENVLSQTKFLDSLKKYVDKSIETGINLFKKAYVYMGDIIDEPDVTGKFDLCNYVCRQYDETLAEAVEYATNVGASAELVDSLSNLQNVVTGRYTDKLPDVGCYCPTADYLDTSAEVEDLKELRNNGKDFWWYTCTLPKIPYPTHHIDDSGISSRVMGWMAKDFEVGGFLMWETIFNLVAHEGRKVLYGKELYDNVHRWEDAYGDGFYFYPGRVFDLDDPVPSMRLYTIRDGMEDYEALHDFENICAQLSKTYGGDINVDGALGQIYSELYSSAKVYCTSADVENAKIRLASLLYLAEKGVAVSDFEINAFGTVSANIYAPIGTKVTLNGENLIFSDNKASVSGNYENFVIALDDVQIDLMNGKVKPFTIDDTARYSVLDQKYAENKNATIVKEQHNGKNTVKIVLGDKDQRIYTDISSINIGKETKSIIIGVYVESNGEKRKAEILLGGSNNIQATLDTIYLKEGYNEIRLDRIGDVPWSKLKKTERLVINFAESGGATIWLASIAEIR